MDRWQVGGKLKILSDTHTLVWALSSSSELSDKARSVLAGGEVVASVASLWELLLKKNRKGALVSDPATWWDRYVARSSIEILGIRQSHIMMLDRLPNIHKDPFDRILVAQALVEKATLVTKDGGLAGYKVPIIW